MAIDKKRFYRGRKKPLPIGEVYAIPLPDGRFSACRVIREGTTEEHSVGDFLVTACAYIGASRPPIDDPDLRRVTPITHHVFGQMRDQRVLGAWVNGPAPKEFVSVGNIPPTDADRAAVVHSFVVWSAITEGIVAEWRWAHDREAVLIEDAAKAARIQRQQEEADRAKAAMTLASFRKSKLLAGWKKYPPPKLAAASRKLLVEASKKLEALGARPPKRAALKVLRECVVALNKLDAKNDHFIETVEREDLCEHIDELAHLAGLIDEDDVAGRWRDW
jgi:hypothetical protein